MEQTPESSTPKTTPTTTPTPEKPPFLEMLWEGIKDWFEDFIDLREGMDQKGTIAAIKNNQRMRGANAWLLMCSIMIASLGLDLNSAAVIIGAMLISPLMSPILGMGLAVAINDRETLFISGRHFGIAILIALATSTFYFWITPLGSLTEQIIMRTEPTFLDGLVAVFGGLAGIISSSRKDVSNAIPGVAIATALMPPLCVTGYGLANANWDIAINSFYLFFLNSFFIAATTFLIIRLMRFRMKKYMNDLERRRTSTYLLIFSLIIIIPSAIILRSLWQERQLELRVNNYVTAFFGDDKDPRVIDHTFINTDTTDQLVIQVFGKFIEERSMEPYLAGLDSFNLSNTELSLIQDADLGLEQIGKMQKELTDMKVLANQLQSVNQARSEQEMIIESLKTTVDSLVSQDIPFKGVCDEAKVLFPKIKSLSYGVTQKTDFTAQIQIDQLPVFLIQWDRSKPRQSRRTDEQKLQDFFKLRTQLDTLVIISY